MTQVITQPAPDLNQKSNIKLIQSDFDAAVFQRGYKVFHDKMIKCPCKVKQGGDNLSSCRNCGGTSWVLVNRFETRMVLQSMNLDTKYKEWSEERLGTVNITALERDRLAHMDRIILIDGESVHNQVIYPQKFKNTLFAFTFYDIKSVIDLFLFVSDTDSLVRLTETTDFTFEKNRVLLSSTFKSIDNLTLSVRYIHSPQFHILDIPRELIQSDIDGVNKETLLGDFPVNAIGRRSHYVLDSQNLTDDYLNDNSYTIVEDC